MRHRRFGDEDLGRLSAWAGGVINEHNLDLGVAWCMTQYRCVAQTQGATSVGKRRRGAHAVHNLELVVHVAGDDRPTALDEVAAVLSDECAADRTLGGRVGCAQLCPEAFELRDEFGIDVVLSLQVQ